MSRKARGIPTGPAERLCKSIRRRRRRRRSKKKEKKEEQEKRAKRE